MCVRVRVRVRVCVCVRLTAGGVGWWRQAGGAVGSTLSRTGVGDTAGLARNTVCLGWTTHTHTHTQTHIYIYTTHAQY